MKVSSTACSWAERTCKYTCSLPPYSFPRAQAVPEDEAVWDTRRQVRSDALAAAVERVIADLTSASTVFLVESTSSSAAMLYGVHTPCTAVMLCM